MTKEASNLNGSLVLHRTNIENIRLTSLSSWVSSGLIGRFQMRQSMVIVTQHCPPSLCRCGWVDNWFGPTNPSTQTAWHHFKPEIDWVFLRRNKPQLIWYSDEWPKYLWLFCVVYSKQANQVINICVHHGPSKLVGQYRPHENHLL